MKQRLLTFFHTMSHLMTHRSHFLIVFFKGGPLICYKKDGKAFLAGVISTTYTNGTNLGIYTTMAKYYTWIYTTIGRENVPEYSLTNQCSKTDPFCRE